MGTQTESGGRRSHALLLVALAFCLLGVLVSPHQGSAASDPITTCLTPCHSAPAFMGPDIATVYLGTEEAAGHKMSWDSRIVEDSSGATLPQGSRMPCTECHALHGGASDSIYMFSEARSGGPIDEVRELCVGCHRPYDSSAGAPVVCGLVLKKLPSGVSDHGQSSSRPCSDCHGSTGHAPEGHGGDSDCGDSACHGGSGSHAIHLSASDPRGPGATACTECHADGGFPFFAEGTDEDESGHIELAEATVCDECHSPGGDYDGVESHGDSVGAKDNWAAKVYETLNSLQPGKEKWCAGCHDGDESVAGEEPSLIGGVYAPPVIGDEDGAYIYGTGWGYYKTGHGTPTTETLPANGYDTGPGLQCNACHDFQQTHVDGNRRSFSSAGTPDTYRASYRLALVGSANPMQIPWGGMTANATTQYRLCAQSGCHDTDPSPYVTSSAHTTNFWNDARTDLGNNMHSYHLGFTNNLRWAPDWGTSMTSRISCPTCHNVHGSKYLAMVQDGELVSDTIERRPGVRIWYWDSVLSSWNETNPDPPVPEDVTLAMSDGWVWRGDTSESLCSHCHHNNNTLDVPRAPWQSLDVDPVLGWVGDTGYENDGSDPDSGSALGDFSFRITYSDANNDTPAAVTLRIDRNDDDDYDDDGESLSMDPELPGDVTYYNGNPYEVTLQLAKAGDDVLSYYVETSNAGGSDVTEVRTVSVTNAAPTLPWTGESGFLSDGVSPNSGTTGITDYEFRIEYRDPDGEAPAGGCPVLYVDKNDDGDFDDVGESVSMTDMGDPSFIDGKRFTYTTTLTRGSDNSMLYRFGASDGFDSAQTDTMTVTVLENINFAPALTWTGEPGYESDGTDPETQAGGKPFFFRIAYTDANDDPPGVAQVWVDLDDDAAYEPGEKFTMDDAVIADDQNMMDGDFANGEILAQKIYVPYVGDGTLKYCFYFEDDNAAEATGVQLTDRTLTVFNALDVPAEYGTIQAAVNASSNGQTVLVGDGTWAGFAYNGKDITVESVNGSAATTISGPVGGYVVDFNSYSGTGSDSTLRGFTVTGGARGIQSNLSNVTVTECVIEGNTAYGIYHQGGSADPIVIDECVIRDNTGPGVTNTNSGAAITVRDTEVSGNSAGGITSGGASLYTIERCTISSNTSSGNGGGILFSSGVLTLVMSDCTIEDNAAGTHGGAVYFTGAAGSSVSIDRTYIRGNRSTGGTSVGGGLYIGQGTYALANMAFVGNYTATNGGGAYVNSGGVTFTNCTFGGNSANSGGAVWCNLTSSGQSKVHNCILWGDDSRGTAYEEIDASTDTSRNRMQVRYSDINQTYTLFYNQTGNITADPQFLDPRAATVAPTVEGDYHLDSDSPCEGQANVENVPALDIDSGSRPQGTGSDMGSDEMGSGIASMSAPSPVSLSLSEDPMNADTDVPRTKPRASKTAPGKVKQAAADGLLSASATDASPITGPVMLEATSESPVPEPSAPVPPALPVATSAIALAALGFRFFRF